MRRWCKGILKWVLYHGSDWFLVICQCFYTFSLADVPHLDKRVVTTCNDIRFELLSQYRANCMCMTNKRMDLPSDSDVPNSGNTVSTSCNKHTKPLMNFETIDTWQMSMVASDDFIHFQIPAFDRLILTTGEQIRMGLRELNSSDSIDMAGESDFQLARCQIPELDCPINTARRKERITWRYSNWSYPALMTCDDSVQFEGRMPFWLDQFADVACSNCSHSCWLCQIHLQFVRFLDCQLLVVFVCFALINHNVLLVLLEGLSNMVLLYFK